MKEKIKQLLHVLGVYHPLQLSYRGIINYLRKVKFRIKYNKFKGEGFQCNVCGNTYSRFVPDIPSKENREAICTNKVIAGYGDNIFCPWCLSTARERLLLEVLKEKDFRNKNILHLSPEKNIYTYLSKHNTVITSDILPGFYRRIDKSILKEDVTCFSFPDNSFHMVIGNHIMEHIPEDTKAMKEILRVLKPGGSAILQVPYMEGGKTIEDPFINDPALQSGKFGQRDHVRIYSLNDYKKRLTEAGFEVVEIPYKDLKVYYKYAIQQHESFLNISKPTF